MNKRKNNILLIYVNNWYYILNVIFQKLFYCIMLLNTIFSYKYTFININ